ncbi:EF hand domain containing protein [Nitzschia inconspicua]|uniref:EF hand domain containing protein n=1 Tax=Nitzschia inconspicua TaxID=303405 RepID=A0A9K3LGT8_9STRA|nr:EF hand domain containing protein [Nitzschia inconspicua]
MKRRRPTLQTTTTTSNSGWLHRIALARQRRLCCASSATILLLMILSFSQSDAYTIHRFSAECTTTSRTTSSLTVPAGRRRTIFVTRLRAFTETRSETVRYNSIDLQPKNVEEGYSSQNRRSNDGIDDFFFANSTSLTSKQQKQPPQRVNGGSVVVSSTKVNGLDTERRTQQNCVDAAERTNGSKDEGKRPIELDYISLNESKDLEKQIQVNSLNGKIGLSPVNGSTKPVRSPTTSSDDNGLDQGGSHSETWPSELSGRKYLNDTDDEDDESIKSKGWDTTKNSLWSRMFSPFKRLATMMTGDETTLDIALNTTSEDDETGSDSEKRPTLRLLWRRRHARTLEEGIRRERTDELSVLMTRAQIDATQGQDRSYVERTLMGVINVLAEEVEDLDIDLTTVRKTPIWRKEVQELRINFSRLGFRPIRMGGTNAVPIEYPAEPSMGTIDIPNDNNVTDLSFVETADEGFDQIDEDNSGTLDRDELAQALSSISPIETDEESIKELAAELLLLYDVNGDGVVDREEYQQMVEDMAKFRSGAKDREKPDKKNPFSAVAAVKESIQSVSQKISKKAAEVASAARDTLMQDDAAPPVDETEMGSIVLTDLNLDLRRLVFGAFPIVKTITPGGPLILEPFTATVTASFSREDVMGSFLLDAGLRRLVARALRVRVRSFRDIVDGALFFGRRWKMFSKTAPVVEVLGLSNVEFDSRDKMVITGRARIRTSPDAPVVTNTFKVRTKIGTRKNGHVIRLVEPELAFVFECPEAVDKGIQTICEVFGIPAPKRPEPLYSFFPIYSPFKVDDNDGFDMGEDNCIRSIYIRDGKLRFEMSAVLRPGRFLGNHYIAFTLPMRTFIITMDRVKEGIRAARENKKVAARAKKLKQQAEAATASTILTPVAEPRPSIMSSSTSFQQSSVSTSTTSTSRQSRLLETLKKNKPKPKSFFTRFVEGYTMLETQGEAKNERLTNEISDWFGRQGGGSNATTTAMHETLDSSE